MDSVSHEAPRTNDGTIDILGLIRQLVEAALDEIMDVQTDEVCLKCRREGQAASTASLLRHPGVAYAGMDED